MLLKSILWGVAAALLITHHAWVFPLVIAAVGTIWFWIRVKLGWSYVRRVIETREEHLQSLEEKLGFREKPPHWLPYVIYFFWLALGIYVCMFVTLGIKRLVI
jgi:hypothetical protein